VSLSDRSVVRTISIIATVVIIASVRVVAIPVTRLAAPAIIAITGLAPRSEVSLAILALSTIVAVVVVVSPFTIA
jgi:hypothetical protein